MLTEYNREDVKKYFPKMRDDVLVHNSSDGKILIGMNGRDDWTYFKKSDGKINSFRGELKKALGPSLKKLKGDYFIRLKSIFPLMDEKYFELTLEKDQFRIWLRGEKTRGIFLSRKDGGGLKERISAKMKKFLGPSSEDFINEERRKVDLNRSRVKEIDDKLKDPEITEDQKENLVKERGEVEEVIGEREKTIEDVEGLMSLKERIKAMFKTYGLALITVTSAVITVISAIVSNLRIGLSKLAKNLGNGLKEIGNKLADILPGMVGAIASFIFNTAGEAIGFLAKHAWLLIIAVVVAAGDRFKKKNK